ncbi:7-cyano-7-deazaguanine/7-aminomethyl-7-deazaguanine transporter, partial [Escherichia coli]
MNVFSQTQRYKALFWLSLFHLLVITSSNYLVQLPVSIFGFHTTWGAFSFPFIFLATDLTVRIFGAPLARRIIFAVMIPALLISYVISSLFYMGSWQGFGALAHFNLFVARIATASFMAYALGQILDVHVFNRLRQSRRWWLAPTASTLFGNVSDTLAFFFIAFWRSPDAFMASAGFGVIATFITLFYDAKGWDGAAFALTLFSCAFVGTRLLFPNGINRIGGLNVAMICFSVEIIGLL